MNTVPNDHTPATDVEHDDDGCTTCKPAITCPDWCTLDHAEDDPRDDLALHQSDDHTDSVTRRLLDAHQLSVRVSRTDDLTAGQAGAPALTVHLDVELTTWEQAAELARTILDGFGYLHGA